MARYKVIQRAVLLRVLAVCTMTAMAWGAVSAVHAQETYRRTLAEQ